MIETGFAFQIFNKMFKRKLEAIIRKDLSRFTCTFRERFGIVLNEERVFLPRAPLASRASRIPVASGIEFEKKVAHIVSRLLYLNHPLHVETTAKTGHLPDIRFSVNGYTVGIEVKRRNAFEGGGKAFTFTNGTLVMNDPFFKTFLPEGYMPFNGRIPKFKLTPKSDPESLEEWLKEKSEFCDEKIEVSSETTVSNYYLKQGSNYILIEGKGLYHTGIDILDLGVPFFKCKCSIRVRCKQHHSTSLPGSIQASINYLKKSIIASPYDLETRLPAKLSQGG